MRIWMFKEELDSVSSSVLLIIIPVYKSSIPYCLKHAAVEPLFKNKTNLDLGLGDMAQKIITIFVFISVDIDNYHNKWQIFISFKFKAIFLLQSESCISQTINFP